MPISSLSDAVLKLTGGSNGNPEAIWWFKDPTSVAYTVTLGRMYSLWTYAGNPCVGTAPTASAVPTNATDGSMRQTNASGGRTKYLTGLYAMMKIQGALILYDRLVHQAGLSGTTTGAQTTNLPTSALTRYSGAASVGNQIWLEIYSPVGTTATTVSATYTNESGTGSKTTPLVTFGGTGELEQTRMIHLPLATGDTGVRSVESVTLSASTVSAAGNFGVTIVRPLALIANISSGAGAVTDYITGKPGPVPIADNACLALMYDPASTTQASFFLTGALQFVESA